MKSKFIFFTIFFNFLILSFISAQNYSLSLNGSESSSASRGYIFFPPPGSGSFSDNNFSVSFWVKGGDNSQSNYGSIFSMGTGVSNRRFSILITGNLHVVGQNNDWNTTYSLPANKWTQITVTYANGTTTLYVNGTSTASTTSYTFNTDIFATTGMVLGKDVAGDDNEYFDGKIDNFLLTSDILTSSEIQALNNYAETLAPTGTTDVENTIKNINNVLIKHDFNGSQITVGSNNLITGITAMSSTPVTLTPGISATISAYEMKLNLWGTDYSILGTTEIDLNGNNNTQHIFTGDSIPSNIDDLVNLHTLKLNKNGLVGEIPTEIAYLSKLQTLAINDNNLTGTIPSEIGSLPQLNHLALWGNNLSGSIPSSIGNLSRLTVLELFNNNLSGSIPSEIGSLTNLRTLWLSNNQFTDTTIPSWIRNLSNLDYLYLENLGLVSIGDDVTTLSTLLSLYLKKNSISSVPSGFSNLSNLQVLDLSENNFSGSIPSQITSLTKIYRLDLQKNSFSSLSSAISNMTALSTLHLNENNFTSPIPPEIGSLSNLREMWFQSNSFSGVLPSEIGSLTKLEGLYLNDNKISGSIPIEIGNLSNLKEFTIHNNNLTGTIPTVIGNLTQLYNLGFRGNDLTGIIPSEIGNLVNLVYLDLDNNRLNGNIPSSIGNLNKLRFLNLSYNELDGFIPSAISNLDSLMDINLEKNRLTGDLPNYFCSFLEAYTNVNLKENYLNAADSTCYPAFLLTENTSVNDNDFNYYPQKKSATISEVKISELTLIKDPESVRKIFKKDFINAESIVVDIKETNSYMVEIGLVDVISLNGPSTAGLASITFNYNDNSSHIFKFRTGQNGIGISWVEQPNNSILSNYYITIKSGGQNGVGDPSTWDQNYLMIQNAIAGLISIEIKDYDLTIDGIGDLGSFGLHGVSVKSTFYDPMAAVYSGKAKVSFSDKVYNSSNRIHNFLWKGDFSLFTNYGLSSLLSSIPDSIIYNESTQNEYELSFKIKGIPNGKEVFSVKTNDNSIFNVFSQPVLGKVSTNLPDEANPKLISTTVKYVSPKILQAIMQFDENIMGYNNEGLSSSDFDISIENGISSGEITSIIEEKDKITINIDLSTPSNGNEFLTIIPLKNKISDYSNNRLHTPLVYNVVQLEDKVSPSQFDLVNPVEDYIVLIDQESYLDTLFFAWNESIDPYNDPIRYERTMTDDLKSLFENFGMVNSIQNSADIEGEILAWDENHITNGYGGDYFGISTDLYLKHRSKFVKGAKIKIESKESKKSSIFKFWKIISTDIEDQKYLYVQTSAIPGCENCPENIPDGLGINSFIKVGDKWTLSEPSKSQYFKVPYHHIQEYMYNSSLDMISGTWDIIAFDNSENHTKSTNGPFKLTINASTLNVSDNLNIPDKFDLLPNYPNPFNPFTNINYSIIKDSKVVLEVYDLLGTKVKTLVSENKPIGFHNTKWDGKDNFGNLVSAGIYIYRIKAGDFIQSKKMIYMK